MNVACIVEGHGEVEAFPILLRRLASDLAPSCQVNVLRPMRIPRGSLVKQGEIERAVEFLARRVGDGGAVIVLMDADDDCPAEIGPRLLARVRAARDDRGLSVVVANREFEAWFLAAAVSLQGARGLPGILVPPQDPETIRDAKGWLSERMGAPYREVLDQPALAARFDLAAARSAPSFDKLVRDFEALLHSKRTL